MADAGKLSVAQLQQAVKNGTVPAYIGIPLMQEKMKQAKQAQPVQVPAQPPIAQQVMAEAAGIDQMPSNLPTQAMNDGGIVAFADGGDVEGFDQEEYEDQQDEAEYAQAIEESLNAAEQGGSRSKPADVNRTPNVEVGIKAPAGDFYKNIYGVLKTKAEEMGFKNPEAIARVGAAQSALETGYGKALAGGNNYFGIKGSGGNRQSTKEYSPERGYYNANESFRTYKGMEDSAADYLRLMQNPRYAKVASAQTPEEAIDYQGRSGYATSPKYGSSLRAIHQSNMAEGGIARLNVPRFNGRSGSVPGYDALGNYTGEIYPEEDTTPSKEPYKDNLAEGSGRGPRNIPGMTTPAGTATGVFRQQRSIKPPPIAMPPTDFLPSQDVSQLGFTPNTPPSRAVNQNTGNGMGEYEPSGFGHGMPDYEQSNLDSPFASDTTEADRLLRRYPAPKSESNAGSTTTAESGAGSTTSSGTGSSVGSSGERQKSEYDLIREDIMNQREELKRQKQEDKYMAILQAGLGMMGGTSPNAFANIGQGASAGIAQYSQSAKQRAAENAALNKGLITAQRYKGMDEYQRAALADRAAGRADIIADRAEGRADTLGDKAEARTLKEKQYNQQVEGQIDLGIAARQKAIEAMVQAKLSKLDPLGSLSGEQQMQKFNQMVQEELAKDIKEGTLKNLYERKKYYQKQNWGIDFEVPNYGAALTSAPSGVTVRKVK
jgi:flagellum-specific peptidoglycan hydrolase FlgJ